jgi:hypothetical protein
LAAWRGHKDVTELFLEAGASLSTVDDEVIKTLVKLRLSNIKPFKKTDVECHLKWGEEKIRHVVRDFVLIV